LLRVKILGYPAPSDLMRAEEPVFWFITTRNIDDCAPWGLDKDPKAVVNNVKDAFNKPYQYAAGLGGGAKAFLNVDHAYEIKFLKEFFTSMLEEVQGGPQCTEFQNFWDKINHASTFSNWEDRPNNYFFKYLAQERASLAQPPCPGFCPVLSTTSQNSLVSMRA
jgi:hypothetical protein